MQRLFAIVIASLLIFALAACGGGADNGAGDQQAQVSAGQTVYTAECAECHDPGGIGPALDAATLASYSTAEGLNTYIHSAMPLDAPGSLTDQQYFDVTAYVLSEAALLPADVVINADTASTVPLQ